MSTTTIADQLSYNSKVFDSVSNRLDNLALLIGSEHTGGLKLTDGGFTYNESLEQTTLYQSEDATICYTVFNIAGATWPDHVHTNSTQFVMVSKGSFRFTNHEDVRVMLTGDFTAVAMGKHHSFEALEDGSILISVCIPPEKAYIVENLKCLRSQEKK